MDKQILKMENRVLSAVKGVDKTTRQTNRRVMHFSKLHPVAQKFFAASAHPFLPSARGAYIPDISARPSQKASARLTYNVSVNASSRLLLFIAPVGVSDVASIVGISGTQSSFGNTNAYYTYSTAPSGLTYGYSLKLPLPYSLATFGDNNLAARGAGFGIRVRYTGTVSNRGGVIHYLHDTANYGREIITDTEATGSLLSTLITKWKSDPRARVCSFHKNDTHEFAVPMLGDGWFAGSSATNVMYTGEAMGSAFGATGGTTYPRPVSVMILDNNSSGAIEFQIDLISHAEFRGSLTTQYQTPSPPAIQDSQIVTTSAERAITTHSQVPDLHPAEHTDNIIGETLNSLKTFGKDVISEVSKDLFTPKNAERLAVGLTSMFL